MAFSPWCDTFWIDKAVLSNRGETLEDREKEIIEAALSARASILRNAEKKDEALTAAEQAIAEGKADGVDTSAFEKRVAGWKSGT